MLFTPAERRLLALVALLLSSGYLISAIRTRALRGADAARAPAGDSTTVTPACPPAPAGASVPAAGAPDSSLFVGGFLELNRADSLALVALPGVGPALAGRILERRRREAFRNLEELLEIKGIGPKKFSQLRDLLVVRRDPDAGTAPAGR